MITDFGVLLTQLLYDAGKTRKQIAEKIAEKKGSPTSDVEEANITRYVTGTRIPDKESTVYSQMSALFPVLISEHVVTSEDQVHELISKIPFKYEYDKTRKHLADSIRDMLVSEVLALLEKQQALDRPRYSTKWDTELIGRDEDIQRVWDMLVDEGKQFVTIVGLPGVGKTELARQIVEINKESKYFANVASLSIRENEGDTDTVLHRIDETLKRYDDLQKRTLLIIHNCERITDLKKARETLYDRVNKQKQLTILATSRATFSLKDHELKPLQNDDAVRLFLAVAKLTPDEGNAPTIAAICKGLGGLPLALELVASRVRDLPTLDGVYKSLQTNEILTLPHAYPDSDRQETLFNLVKWSYDLFAPQVQIQKLFIRLAIFAAPCHIEAVEAICTLEDVPKEQLSNFLWKLNDHRLIIFDGKIINISHPIIYQFACDMFDKIDIRSWFIINTRFLNYYYYLMQNVKDVDGETQPELARLLIGEFDNFFKVRTMILYRNVAYIEDNIVNRVTKEEYDIYEKTQNQCKNISTQWSKEAVQSHPRLFPFYFSGGILNEKYLERKIIERGRGYLILLPQMGLYEEDANSENYEEIYRTGQMIELALRDAISIYVDISNSFKVDITLQELNRVMATMVEPKALARYKKVYLTRIQLMNECRQTFSLKKIDDFISENFEQELHDLFVQEIDDVLRGGDGNPMKWFI